MYHVITKLNNFFFKVPPHEKFQRQLQKNNNKMMKTWLHFVKCHKYLRLYSHVQVFDQEKRRDDPIKFRGLRQCINSSVFTGTRIGYINVKQAYRNKGQIIGLLMVNKYVLLTAFVTINQILYAFDGSMKNNTGASKMLQEGTYGWDFLGKR